MRGAHPTKTNNIHFMEQYMIPAFGKDKFQCPHCNTLATQEWFNSYNASSAVTKIFNHIFLDYRQGVESYVQNYISSFLKNTNRNFQQVFTKYIPTGFALATCSSCQNFTLWVNEEIVYPKKTTVLPPNDDLDEDIKALYIEASSILIDSPKGSTALLRLALQKLLKQIGGNGKNINNDIKDLVADNLSPQMQKALDLLRVVGNNAVHPGQIDLDDNIEIARKLFDILNYIAYELITKPKELESLYSDLVPLETQEHIKQRDKQK